MSHYYLQDGSPFHFQPDGKATTLRHARKENALPSVTTILGILDKPALVNWKLKRVTEACFADQAIATPYEWESYDGYHKKMLADAFAESTDARDRGSEIHDCIEALVRDESRDKFDSGIQEIARAALVEILRYAKLHRQDVIAEKTVVGDGYGGMVDLHNDDFCIDWKTTDIKPEQTGKYLAWPEMAMQLSAYDQALSMSRHGTKPLPGRRCINVFIDRTEPGLVRIHEWKPEDIELAWEKFQLLVKFWQMDKKYYPEAV